MKLIARMTYGSHLYGTATADSDLDIRAVGLPCARDILLQQVTPVLSGKDHKGTQTQDWESYSLHKYLDLLAQGQLIALDMLFAPDWAMLMPPDELWTEIKAFAPQIMTKNTSSFIRYCHQQTQKYRIKGNRLAAARAACRLFEQHNPEQKLATLIDELTVLTARHDALRLSRDEQPNGRLIDYFEICDKKVPLSAAVKTGYALSQKLVAGYGERAESAESAKGTDWKALSHAVRIGHEAIEFLTTSQITFPRPEAQHLLDIRQGRVAWQSVAEEIEQLLTATEQAAERSTLPHQTNRAILDDFVAEHYERQVKTT